MIAKNADARAREGTMREDQTATDTILGSAELIGADNFWRLPPTERTAPCDTGCGNSAVNQISQFMDTNDSLAEYPLVDRDRRGASTRAPARGGKDQFAELVEDFEPEWSER